MNDQTRPADLPLTTQAAEGLPRRRWLTSELLKLACPALALKLCDIVPP